MFPCAPGRKQPLTARGFLDATTDTEQIEAWLSKHPKANVAIPTAGLVIIDVDGSDNAWLADKPDRIAELATGALAVTPPRNSHVTRSSITSLSGTPQAVCAAHGHREPRVRDNLKAGVASWRELAQVGQCGSVAQANYACGQDHSDLAATFIGSNFTATVDRASRHEWAP